jgi:hypothetical protein
MFYMDMKDEFSVSLSALCMVGLIDRRTYKHIFVSLVGNYSGILSEFCLQMMGACALSALICGTGLVGKIVMLSAHLQYSLIA